MTLRLWPDVAHLTDLEKFQRDLIEAFPAEMELNLTNGVLTGNRPLVTVGTRFTHILLSKSILVGINLDIQVAHEENFNFHPETRTKAPNKIFITCLVKMFCFPIQTCHSLEAIFEAQVLCGSIFRASACSIFVVAP